MVNDRGVRVPSVTAVPSARSTTAATYPPFGPRSIHHPVDIVASRWPSARTVTAVSRSNREVTRRRYRHRAERHIADRADTLRLHLCAAPAARLFPPPRRPPLPRPRRPSATATPIA